MGTKLERFVDSFLNKRYDRVFDDFREDKSINDKRPSFRIAYLDLDGGKIGYVKPADKFNDESNELYYSYRLKQQIINIERDEEGKISDVNSPKKYDKPKTSEKPYFTGLFRYFHGKYESIDTLYFIEGEKKAMSMCSIGIPTVGMGGITSIFKSKKNKRGDIINAWAIDEVLSALKREFKGVKELVLVHDADALNGDTMRRNLFEQSVRTFEYFCCVNNYGCYYSMIKYNIDLDNGKGADDIIVGKNIQDKAEFNSYLDIYDLTDSSEQYDGFKLKNKFTMGRDLPIKARVTDYLVHEEGISVDSFSDSLCQRGELISNRTIESIRLRAVEKFTSEESKKVIEEVDHGVDYKGNDIKVTKIVKTKQIASDGIVKTILRSDDIPVKNYMADWLVECVSKYQDSNIGSEHFDKFVNHFELDEDYALTKEQMGSIWKRWMLGSVHQSFNETEMFRISDKSVVNLLFPILIGGTNLGKTHMVRNMLPQRLFDRYGYEMSADALVGKDRDIMIGSYAVALIDDYSVKSKADAAELREMLSKGSIKVRKPYTESDTIMPRRASFIGTSNLYDIVNDPKNNRRVLPICIVDRDYNLFDSIDIELMWGYIVDLYLNGERIDATPEEVEVFRAMSREHAVDSIERDMVSEYLIPAIEVDGVSDSKMPVWSYEEIVREFSFINSNAKINLVKLKEALSELGFERSIGRSPVHDGRQKRGFKFFFREASPEIMDKQKLIQRTF